MKKFKEYINEMRHAPVDVDVTTNNSRVYITSWDTKLDITYEFSASITDDLATISFYEKGSKLVGAKKDSMTKYDAFGGVFESIKRLLNDKPHIKRLYFVSADRDLERYHDMLSKSKLEDIKFDYSERDIHGRKCYWYSRKE